MILRDKMFIVLITILGFCLLTQSSCTSKNEMENIVPYKTQNPATNKIEIDQNFNDYAITVANIIDHIFVEVSKVNSSPDDVFRRLQELTEEDVIHDFGTSKKLKFLFEKAASLQAGLDEEVLESLELSEMIVNNMESLPANSQESVFCATNMGFCMLTVMVWYTNAIADVAGFGVDMGNPDNVQAANAVYYTAVFMGHGCVSDYIACEYGY